MYAKCLKALGRDVVHKYQGKEPSGRKSNAILLDHNSKSFKRYYNIYYVLYFLQGDICSFATKISEIDFMFFELPDKPFNPLVDSGAIMSTALLLDLVERDNKSSEALSTTYEHVYDTIRVRILAFLNHLNLELLPRMQKFNLASSSIIILYLTETSW